MIQGLMYSRNFLGLSVATKIQGDGAIVCRQLRDHGGPQGGTVGETMDQDEWKTRACFVVVDIDFPVMRVSGGTCTSFQGKMRRKKHTHVRAISGCVNARDLVVGFLLTS